MKLTKSFKIFITMFVFMSALVMIGTKAEALEPTYTPITVNNFSVNHGSNAMKVTVQPDSSVVIPIVMPSKGGMDLAIVGEENNGSSKLYSGYLYADAACTVKTDQYFGYINAEPVVKVIESQSATTYYLLIKNSSSEEALSAQILGYFYSGENKTISSDKVYTTYQNDYEKYVYHKFKAKKTGYISFSAICRGTYSNIKVKLLSSKKKSLSNEIYLNKYNNYTIGFGVEKGKTYYIATKAGYKDVYNLIYKFTSVKEKSGSKQSKAVYIKKNKTIKGVQLANNKKSGNDWYKIKLTKNQKIKFYITGRSTGNINIKIIPANKNMIIYGDTLRLSENGKGKYQTKDKFSAGTYYLKVYKNDKKASGYYSIKWK